MGAPKTSVDRLNSKVIDNFIKTVDTVENVANGGSSNNLKDLTASYFGFANSAEVASYLTTENIYVYANGHVLNGNSDPDGVYGGHYFMLTDESLTANAGTIFAADSSFGANMYWKLEYSGAVEASWFDLTGDGVSDDTTSLVSLFSLGLSDATISLERGKTYLVDPDSISLTGSNIIIEGNHSTIKCSNETFEYIIAITEGSNITIRNLIIDGAYSSGSGNFTSSNGAIKIFDGDAGADDRNIYIEDCYFKNIGTKAIFTYGISGITIKYNKFENCVQSVNGNRLAGTSSPINNILVSHNKIISPPENTNSQGIKFTSDGIVCQGIVIDNNYLDARNLQTAGYSSAGIAIEVWGDFNNSTVSGNQIIGRWGMGISIANDALDTTVTGNSIRGVNSNLIEFANCNRFTCTGNMMNGLAWAGSAYSTAGISCDGAQEGSITGNIIEYISGGTAANFIIGGSADQSTTNIVFSGNFVRFGSDSGAHAIKFVSSATKTVQDIYVTNNIFYSEYSSGTVYFALVNAGGDCGNLSICNNYLKGKNFTQMLAVLNSGGYNVNFIDFINNTIHQTEAFGGFAANDIDTVTQLIIDNNYNHANEYNQRFANGKKELASGDFTADAYTPEPHENRIDINDGSLASGKTINLPSAASFYGRKITIYCYSINSQTITVSSVENGDISLTANGHFVEVQSFDSVWRVLSIRN